MPTKAAGVAPIGAKPRGAEAPPLVSEALELLAADGGALQIRVRTELGKGLLRQLGSEAEFWDDRQCVIERTGRQWVVAPVAGTTNETLLNGRTLSAPHALRQGDRIAVGRQAKGVIKLPLTARGR